MDDRQKERARAHSNVVKLQEILRKSSSGKFEVLWDPGTEMLAVRFRDEHRDVLSALQRHVNSLEGVSDPIGPILKDDHEYYYLPDY